MLAIFSRSRVGRRDQLNHTNLLMNHLKRKCFDKAMEEMATVWDKGAPSREMLKMLLDQKVLKIIMKQYFSDGDPVKVEEF